MEKNKLKIKADVIEHLSLLDNAFFTHAAENNLSFAEFLIKPVFDYLGIRNYKIISAETEVFENHFKNRSVRLDLKIVTEDGRHIVVEVQNTHPERMSLRRLRYIKSSHDVKSLEEGEDYSKLPELILICYTRNPLEELDDMNPVAVLELANKITCKFVYDGSIIFIINNKYKDEAFESFSEVIEELAKEEIEEIVNPLIKDIHLKTKRSRKGVKDMEDLLDRYISEYAEELEKLEVKLKEKDEIIQESENDRLKIKEDLIKSENDRLKAEEKAKSEIERLQRIILEAGLSIE